MNDAEQRKYYRAGVRAAWQSLNPLLFEACFDAWFEYAMTLPNKETEAFGDRILIQFAWGWRWVEDRFRDEWIGVPPAERGVGMEALWR